jgi:hypothetical protein
MSARSVSTRSFFCDRTSANARVTSSGDDDGGEDDTD